MRGKTPMLYRLWGKQRRRIIKQWEKDNIAKWDTSRPGLSALDAAYRRNLEVEIAIECGLEVGVILWDFTKFFDMIRLKLLAEAAVRLGFPIIDLVLGLQLHMATRWLGLLGMVGQKMAILRSILPGCILSIPFTRGHGCGAPFSTILTVR